MQNADFLNIQNIFYKIYSFLRTLSLDVLKDFIIQYWELFVFIAFLISILLIIGIIYLTIKLNKVEKKDEEIYGTIFVSSDGGEESIKNERWLRVLEHLESDLQSEWRASILEADIILDEMTIKMSYHGDTLGERLNSVERSDFTTIDKAWEAHKVRNIIAHEGSNFEMTKREVKRIIDLYRQVFEEFNFI